jgi:putative oxidoreductase
MHTVSTGDVHQGDRISRTGVEHSSAHYQPPSHAASRGLQLAGRAILGGFFIYNAFNHFRNREALTEYARAKDVPMPDVAVTATGVMMLLGGLSLLTGAKPKVGAGLVTTFLAGVSPMMHGFWREPDQAARMQESIHFMKNMAIAGGALFAGAMPEPWPDSVRLSR